MIDELRTEIEDDGFNPDAVVAWSDYTGDEVTEWDAPTREAFGDAYNGEWDSEEDYAEGLVDSLGMLSSLDESLRCYFDYEAFARDLFMGDHYSVDTGTGKGTVYVFRNC